MVTQISPVEQTEPVSRPSGDPAGKSRQGGRISLLDLLAILAEQKRLILLITVAFTVLSVVVSLLLPARYTARATLLPPQQSSSLSTALSAQLGDLGGVAALAGGSLSLKNPNDMYVGMLTSRTVQDAMVTDFGLMAEYHTHYLSDARKTFQRYATVDGSGKDGLIHISVEDRNPKRAAELANGYVTEFQRLSAHLAITEASQRRLFFEQQLEEAKDNLANAEEALKQTEQKTGLIQLDSQARALIESVESLRAQITAKEVQLQAMQTYATGENPQYIETQKELDELRAQLAKLGGSESGSDASLIVPKGQVPEASLEYVRRLRDVRYYETIFDILARQFEIAKLDEAREGAIIQVVDKAIPPDRRSSPKRSLIVAVSTALGFLLGILVALVKASVENMKSHEETSFKLERLRRSFSGSKS